MAGSGLWLPRSIIWRQRTMKCWGRRGRTAPYWQRIFCIHRSAFADALRQRRARGARRAARSALRPADQAARRDRQADAEGQGRSRGVVMRTLVLVALVSLAAPAWAANDEKPQRYTGPGSWTVSNGPATDICIRSGVAGGTCVMKERATGDQG